MVQANLRNSVFLLSISVLAAAKPTPETSTDNVMELLSKIASLGTTLVNQNSKNGPQQHSPSQTRLTRNVENMETFEEMRAMDDINGRYGYGGLGFGFGEGTGMGGLGGMGSLGGMGTGIGTGTGIGSGIGMGEGIGIGTGTGIGKK